MPSSRKPIPVADGCRLILAQELLGNVDLALSFLGLEKSELSLLDETAAEVKAEVAELDPSITEIVEPIDVEWDADESEDLEAVADSDDLESVADLLEEERAQSVLELEWSPSGDEGSGHGSRPRDFFLRHSRSMIAHLLSPDERTEEKQEQARPDYERIPERVQHVQRRRVVPDSESWRVAIRLSDSGPRFESLGKVDIRECVHRIARCEVITTFPRKKTRKQKRAVELLVDSDLSKSLFSFDIELLESTLRSMSSSKMRIRRIFGRDDAWFAGDGPIWTFTPLTPEDRPAWYMLIVGGQAAAPDNLEHWSSLIQLLERTSPVSVVWIGDREGIRTSSWDKRWIAFR